MKPRRLKNRAAIPFEDGRHVWRFYEAPTDTWLTDPLNLDALVHLVTRHRAVNSLPMGHPSIEVEAQICGRLPESLSYR